MIWAPSSERVTDQKTDGAAKEISPKMPSLGRGVTFLSRRGCPARPPGLVGLVSRAIMMMNLTRKEATKKRFLYKGKCAQMWFFSFWY